MPVFSAILYSGLMALASLRFQAVQQIGLWQADLTVRSLIVSQANGTLTARVVVSTESGEALGARLEVLLPVGVGIVTVGPGCVSGPSPTRIRELRARVECTVGNLRAGSNREFQVTTTTPPAGVTRRFAAVVMSETPDPRPGNNFVEKSIP